MNYTVVFTGKAIKELKKLDGYTAKLLLSWIHKHLEGCDNPRRYGKALVANRNGQWRYRVGNYRLLAEIDDAKIVILILAVGHRRAIYEK